MELQFYIKVTINIQINAKMQDFKNKKYDAIDSFVLPYLISQEVPLLLLIQKKKSLEKFEKQYFQIPANPNQFEVSWAKFLDFCKTCCSFSGLLFHLGLVYSFEFEDWCHRKPLISYPILVHEHKQMAFLWFGIVWDPLLFILTLHILQSLVQVIFYINLLLTSAENILFTFQLCQLALSIFIHLNSQRDILRYKSI